MKAFCLGSSLMPVFICLLLALTTQAMAGCTVSASGVAFGSYNPNSPVSTEATMNIEVSCTLMPNMMVSSNILLSTGGGNSFIMRSMGSGANRLAYNLYTSAAHSAVWGDGTGGTATVSDAFLAGVVSTVRNYSVYGRIPGGQSVAAGMYSDTITVTFNY